MRKITFFACFLLSITAVFAVSEKENTTAGFDNPDFVLDANGVTCKCDNASIGDTGTLVINGVSKTFTKRSEAQLRALINANQNDIEIELTCTSGIDNMSSLFKFKTNSNVDISHWDVSDVITMESMFNRATSFDKNITFWDVTNVTDMSRMFEGASKFNQPIGNWNVLNVINMSYMFDGASIFNGSIGNWNVAKVKNMQNMFPNTYTFNQDLSNWNVSAVTNMAFMFYNTRDFGQDLSSWDVSSVINMTYMFGFARSFNFDLSNWCVTNIPTLPNGFITNSSFLAINIPIWGSCPTSCTPPEAGDITASSAQVGTDVVFTINAPAGVTVSYSGDASGTGVNGDTVTVAQSVLTSGTASITLDNAYLTADNTCTTAVGTTESQAFCNAPVAGDITASSTQVGADVVFTINAPAGVTVSYSGDASGTGVNGDTVTVSQAVLTSGTASITLDSAYLTGSNPVCETTLNKDYEQEYCNAPNVADVYATSAQVGTDIQFTIYAPIGVTVTYFYQNMNGPDSANSTAVNGDIITIQQDALTSGQYYFVIGEARLTSDEFCYTTVTKEYFQSFCNAPQVSDANLIPSVSEDDIVFTVDASANVTVEITSVQGSITAVDGDVITFVDGNLIHSVVFSATITGAYLTSDNGCATDYDPDREISFTVPRSRHPLAIDDVHTLNQTKSRSIRPLKRGTDDSDPNGLDLRVKTINGIAVLGGVQSIPVPNGVLTIDDEDNMWFKSDNSFTGLTQFPYEVINTDRYEDDGVVFVDVIPLPKQPTDPTAVDDFYSMQQGTTIEVKPLTKGVDDNDPNDLDLFITAIDGTPITGVGQIIAVTDGSVEVLNAEATEFAFTPDSSFSGTTTFDYTITSLIEDTDTATITLIVDPLPQGLTAPIATDDAYMMDQGTTIDLKPLTKSTDDSDPNDLELTIVSINSVALTGGVQSIAVPNGQVDIDVNDDITFTPDVAFTNGVIMFPYTIRNTINLTDSALQNIAVNAVTVSNGAPTATDDNYITDQGEERRIRPLTKGVNDSDPNNNDLFVYSIAGEEIDYDNLPQTIAIVIATTTVGSVTFEDENDITFTPASSTTGTVSFPYVIVNETITPNTMPSVTNSASANQIIEVIPVPGGDGNPVAIDDTYSLKQGSSREIKPLTRHYDDYDPNELALEITHLGGEEVHGGEQDILIPNAKISINADDEIFFVPNPSFSGTITFAYKIKNTNDDEATGMVTMIIDAVSTSNLAPRAIDDVYTINKNTKKKIAPLNTGESDKDPNGEVLSLTYINGEEVYGGNQIIEVPNGKLEVITVNDITFIPNKDYLGVAMFSYEIINETGISDTGLQTINILESNALDTNSFVISPQDFSVYPNPSKGNVFVKLTSTLSTKANITLFDITGKTLHRSNIKLVEGQNTLDFNFKVSAGMLFLKVSTNNQSIVRKLIIK
jgi:surface protein